MPPPMMPSPTTPIDGLGFPSAVAVFRTRSLPVCFALTPNSLLKTAFAPSVPRKARSRSVRNWLFLGRSHFYVLNANGPLGVLRQRVSPLSTRASLRSAVALEKFLQRLVERLGLLEIRQMR